MLSVHRLREYTLLLLRSRTGLHGLQYDIGPVTASSGVEVATYKAGILAFKANLPVEGELTGRNRGEVHMWTVYSHTLGSPIHSPALQSYGTPVLYRCS